MLGAVSALILGLPLVGEIKDRRHWDRFSAIMRRTRPSSGPQTSIQQRLKDQLLDDRLGDHERYRFIALWGFLFMFLAFLSLGVAAVGRLWGIAE